MNKFIIFIFLLFSLFSFGQNRNEIISIMKEYSANIGKPNYSHEFVDKKLNPALAKLETIICEKNDKELFHYFLDMILATSGSANETPADVLGGIFICKTDLVIAELKGNYKFESLIEDLNFGFGNRTFDVNDRPSNYKELKLRIKEISN